MKLLKRKKEKRNRSEMQEKVIAGNYTSLRDLIKMGDWDSVMERLLAGRWLGEAACEDDNGSYPIHHACCKGDLPVYVLKALLEAFPIGVQKQQNNDVGCLPLHCAIVWNASMNVIDCLIQAFPGAAREQEKCGWLPIHFAAAGNKSIDVINRLIHIYPEGVHQKTKMGWLAIHCAAQGATTSAEVIDCLIEAYPAGLLQRDVDGKTPRELAIIWNRPSCIVSSLTIRAGEEINKNFSNLNNDFAELNIPNAMPERTPHGAENLVDLIGSKKWDSVIECLTTDEGRREASQRNWVNDEYPIHMACRQPDFPLHALNALLEAYPEGLRQQDEDGWLPLHFALTWNSSPDIIFHLVSLYPEGVQQQEKSGWLPLHSAAASNIASVEIINYLIEIHPEGVQQKTKEGYLPIHCAAQSATSSTEIMDLLIHFFPEGVRQKDMHGRTPKDLAISWDSSLDISSCFTEEDKDLNNLEESSVSLSKDQKHSFFLAQQADTEQQRLATAGDSLYDQNILAQEEMTPRPGSFLFLIEQKKWDDLSNKLTTTCGDIEASCVCNVNSKQYPIHYVCNNADTPLNIIESLCNAYPKGLHKADISGRLPIHLACANSHSVDVIKQLIEANPEGLQKKDDNGELPIHHAARSNAFLEVTKLLVKAYPDSVQQQNNTGLLPSHVAANSNTSWDVFYQLLACPKQMQQLETHENNQNYVAGI